MRRKSRRKTRRKRTRRRNRQKKMRGGRRRTIFRKRKSRRRRRQTGGTGRPTKQQGTPRDPTPRVVRQNPGLRAPVGRGTVVGVVAPRLDMENARLRDTIAALQRELAAVEEGKKEAEAAFHAARADRGKRDANSALVTARAAVVQTRNRMKKQIGQLERELKECHDIRAGEAARSAERVKASTAKAARIRWGAAAREKMRKKAARRADADERVRAARRADANERVRAVWRADANKRVKEARSAAKFAERWALARRVREAEARADRRAQAAEARVQAAVKSKAAAATQQEAPASFYTQLANRLHSAELDQDALRSGEVKGWLREGLASSKDAEDLFNNLKNAEIGGLAYFLAEWSLNGRAQFATLLNVKERILKKLEDAFPARHTPSSWGRSLGQDEWETAVEKARGENSLSRKKPASLVSGSPVSAPRILRGG